MADTTYHLTPCHLVSLQPGSASTDQETLTAYEKLFPSSGQDPQYTTGLVYLIRSKAKDDTFPNPALEI